MMTITKKTALLVVALTLVLGGTANAQRGRVVVVPRGHVYAPFFYDPWLGPYYPYYPPYPYAGYYAYPYLDRSAAEVKTQVTPKQAQVYVDGYYAGVADDFDGWFKRLQTSPGGHEITLYLDGYRTVTESIYVRPNSTFTLRSTLEKLPAGEVSAPPPAPMSRPEPDVPPDLD